MSFEGTHTPLVLELSCKLVILSVLLILINSSANRLSAQDTGDSTFVDSTDSTAPDTLKQRKIYRASFDSEVKYSASDSIKIRAKEKIIYLYGSAEVYYKDMEIKADLISIDFKNNVMDAIPTEDSAGVKKGIPFFKDKDNEMKAQRIRYNFKTREGVIYELVTEEADGVIYGEKVKKDEFDNMYISEARYTTCQDTSHPHFYIKANKMKVIPGEKIVSGPAFLYLGDVPTPGFIPFGFFPITSKRSSGILMPNYGYSVGRGYFLRNGGYYFGISDYIDLALTGDIYANLSWRANATSSYAKRYKYSGNFSLDYAVLKTNEREDPDFTAQRTSFVTWTHRLDPKARPNTSFNANVQLGSADFLRQNSYNQNDIVRNTLQSSISYGRNFGWSNLTLSANHDQNNATGAVNVTLPNFRFDVNRFFPFRPQGSNGGVKGKPWQDLGFTYNTSFKNRLTAGDSVFWNPETLERLQYGMDHNIAMAGNFKILKYIAFSPSVNYTDYWYLTSTRKEWNATERAIEEDTVNGFVRGFQYSFSSSFGTQLYGMYTFKERSRVKAIRHQMSPGISLTYRPDFSQDKFGFYKQVQSDTTGENFATYSIFEKGIFNGPGRGEQGMISFNLTNNLEMKVKDESDTVKGERKIKLLETFAIFGGYNFLADSLKLAPFNVQIRTVLFKQFNVQFNATYNPYAYDSNGTAINTWLKEQTGQFLRMTNMRLNLTTSLNAETLKGKATPGRPRPMRNPYLNSQQLVMLNDPGNYVDFNIPLNLNLNYIYNLTNTGIDIREVQTINFSGDFSLTEKWKIGFSSGYDFVNKNLSMTSIDFYRDLHCWEFRFNWVPFGPRQYFTFTLNAKSSVLQDLKLNRRKEWFDR